MNFKLKIFSGSLLQAAVKVVFAILAGELSIMVAIEGVFAPFFGKNVMPLFWEFMDPIANSDKRLAEFVLQHRVR